MFYNIFSVVVIAQNKLECLFSKLLGKSVGQICGLGQNSRWGEQGQDFAFLANIRLD